MKMPENRRENLLSCPWHDAREIEGRPPADAATVELARANAAAAIRRLIAETDRQASRSALPELAPAAMQNPAPAQDDPPAPRTADPATCPPLRAPRRRRRARRGWATAVALALPAALLVIWPRLLTALVLGAAGLLLLARAVFGAAATGALLRAGSGRLSRRRADPRGPVAAPARRDRSTGAAGGIGP